MVRSFVGDVGAAAGPYEQCDHRLAPKGLDGLAKVSAVRGGLVASGLVGCGGALAHHRLRSMAGSDRLSDFDRRIVAASEVLGAVRLHADAELIVWQGIDGSRTATPVSRLLDECASIVLGGPDLAARPDWSAPLVLRAAALPGSSEIEFVALVAMTFAEFVDGAR